MTVHPSTLHPPTDPRDPGYPADDRMTRAEAAYERRLDQMSPAQVRRALFFDVDLADPWEKR